MAPIIDIVRHAESQHQIEGDHLRDPSLTEKGISQAVGLGETYPYMDDVKAIVSSPMRRAIQTTRLAFSPLIKEKSMLILCIRELQETSARPSDTGSPWQELRYEFGSDVDLSLLYGPEWYKDTTGVHGPDPARVAERARQARVFIRDNARALGDCDRVVVVTHSQFVRVLIQGEPEFKNAEYRSCQFDDLFGDDDQAILREIAPAGAEGV
ncbi:histidine phosphatase superfamily [Nemania sp. NC0429]|nr:histidine phosphatase superfamily [Nemania sp. NC0429]